MTSDQGAEFSPELKALLEEIALLSEPAESFEELYAVAASAVLAYARRVGDPPRTVAEDLFKDLPDEERWHREVLPELDRFVADARAARVQAEEDMGE